MAPCLTLAFLGFPSPDESGPSFPELRVSCTRDKLEVTPVSGLSPVFWVKRKEHYMCTRFCHSVLVSCGFRYKWPQTQWLKTAALYCLAVVEARSLNSSRPRALLALRAPSAASARGWWHHVSLHSWPCPPSVCLPLHVAFFPSVPLSPSAFLLQGHLSLG